MIFLSLWLVVVFFSGFYRLIVRIGGDNIGK